MRKYVAESMMGGKNQIETYREELRRREPDAVNNLFLGGAYGCPGEYFRGAAAWDCRGNFRVRCQRCWSSLYDGEEWIPPEKRDE